MGKRISRTPPLTPMRLQMLRDAGDHGNALHTLQHGSPIGVARAVKIMCDLGYLEFGTGRITPAGSDDPGAAWRTPGRSAHRRVSVTCRSFSSPPTSRRPSRQVRGSGALGRV